MRPEIIPGFFDVDCDRFTPLMVINDRYSNNLMFSTLKFASEDIDYWLARSSSYDERITAPHLLHS